MPNPITMIRFVNPKQSSMKSPKFFLQHVSLTHAGKSCRSSYFLPNNFDDILVITP